MRTWLEKHVPTSLDDFICYQDEMQQIRTWIENFKLNSNTSKKVLFLIGSSGIGKTKMCEVLLNEYNYRVMEYNSSELRSQKRITEVLEKSLTYRNVFEMMEEENKPVGILIDEIEGLIGTGDKGGFAEFLDILKSNMKYEEYLESLQNKKKGPKKKCESKFIRLVSPILCTSFESNEKKVQELKKYSQVITFQKPKYEDVNQLIDSIAEKENMFFTEESKQFLFQYMDGDIRKCIITMEQINKYFERKIIERPMRIERRHCDDIQRFLTQKDEDDTLLHEIQKVFERPQLSAESCDRIFQKECLLLPLVVYHNTVGCVKNTKMEIKETIGRYRNTLYHLCMHDRLQTKMFRTDDSHFEDNYDIASFYSMQCSNYYMQPLENGGMKYENTNLLNKISQMLVNRKLIQNARRSVQKLNVETDEILYIVHILSYFLGDLKNNMDLEETKLEEMKMKQNHELTTFMNQYGITMEDLENIMKIEKLNRVDIQVKKKKFTMKLKKEIETKLQDNLIDI